MGVNAHRQPIGLDSLVCNWCVGLLAKTRFDLSANPIAKQLLARMPARIMEESKRRVATYQDDFRRRLRDATWQELWYSPLLSGVAGKFADPSGWLMQIRHMKIAVTQVVADGELLRGKRSTLIQ